MHYYKRNIGDYHKKAGRLSILQHGVYVLLMDAIYDREVFPTEDQAIDWIWASTTEEIEAVKFVLAKFFKVDNGVYIQNRISQEIEEYTGLCISNAINGKKGGRPKGSKNKPKETQSLNEKTQSLNLESELNPSESDSNPNHKPITTNHKPNKDKSTKADQIPYSKIANLYNEVCTNLPKVLKPENLNDKRKRAIKKFWNHHKDNQNSQFFAEYFELANQDSFFCGFNNNDSHSNWRADIEFLMRVETYDKFMERQECLN